MIPLARPRPQASRLAPEVVQTSVMDCGPAALQSLARGFGLPVSYGRLREACQTGVDGTSISMMDEIARFIGLDTEEMMLPADHLLVAEAHALPAIAVVKSPSGANHFVIVWSVAGPWVQVMDPAEGRRWISRAALLDRLYRHQARRRPGAAGSRSRSSWPRSMSASRRWASRATPARGCARRRWPLRAGRRWPRSTPRRG